MSSGSKRRRSISVDASGSARLKCAKPHEWNIGAAIIVVCRARSGIFENSAATGSSVSGWLRAAPFGVPVVPDVSITTRPLSVGGSSSEVSPRSISCSMTGSSGLDPGALQDSMRRRPCDPSATRPLNSSS